MAGYDQKKYKPMDAFQYKPGQVYKEQAAPTSLAQFDLQRKQAQGRIGQQAQQQSEALNRRLAGMGGPAGAGLKLQQQLGEQQARTQEDVLGGIAAQEAGAIEAQREAERQRAYGSQEAETARAAEADQFGYQSGQQERQFGSQFGQQERQFGAQHGLAKRAADLERQAQLFNMGIAGSELGEDQLQKASAMTRRLERGKSLSSSLGSGSRAGANYTRSAMADARIKNMSPGEKALAGIK